MRNSSSGCCMRSMPRQQLDIPTRLIIPLFAVALRQQVPAQLFEYPVPLDGIREHRTAHPVTFVVGTASCNRNDVINGWKHFPVCDVTLCHLSVFVVRKLFR